MGRGGLLLVFSRLAKERRAYLHVVCEGKQADTPLFNAGMRYGQGVLCVAGYTMVGA